MPAGATRAPAGTSSAARIVAIATTETEAIEATAATEATAVTALRRRAAQTRKAIVVRPAVGTLPDALEKRFAGNQRHDC